MPTTWEAAYDDLTDALIAGVVGLGASSNLPADPTVRFTGVEQGAIPKDAYLRFTMNPVLERQATFRANLPDGSKPQRYTATGVIIIQCFVPRHLAETAEESLRLLSTSVKKLYRGKQFGDSCVWVRNVRVNKLDPEPTFLRANVVGEYEYDEIG
jgi:hypothetical protein